MSDGKLYLLKFSESLDYTFLDFSIFNENKYKILSIICICITCLTVVTSVIAIIKIKKDTHNKSTMVSESTKELSVSEEIQASKSSTEADSKAVNNAAVDEFYEKLESLWYNLDNYNRNAEPNDKADYILRCYCGSDEFNEYVYVGTSYSSETAETEFLYYRKYDGEICSYVSIRLESNDIYHNELGSESWCVWKAGHNIETWKDIIESRLIAYYPQYSGREIWICYKNSFFYVSVDGVYDRSYTYTIETAKIEQTAYIFIS